jgi:hypothetical protein
LFLGLKKIVYLRFEVHAKLVIWWFTNLGHKREHMPFGDVVISKDVHNSDNARHRKCRDFAFWEVQLASVSVL